MSIKYFDRYEILTKIMQNYGNFTNISEKIGITLVKYDTCQKYGKEKCRIKPIFIKSVLFDGIFA